jgi:CheY-like chemotaxis protein
MSVEPIQILLVEDSPQDVELAREVLDETRVLNEVHVVTDGEAAMDFMRGLGEYAGSPRPDLVLLDLNLPRKDGREVLHEIKADPVLRRVPVIVLTTSAEERDVLRAYDDHVNAYIQKPLGLDAFVTVAQAIDDFWLAIVRLPRP